MRKTTKQWSRFWKNRKIDWDAAYGSGKEAVEHPHRKLIIKAIRDLGVSTLMEIGCGAGVNLVNIRRYYPQMQVGGVDVNEEAIETAKRLIPNGILDARSADDLFFDRKSVDCTLSDMCQIYFSPLRIGKVLKEIKRVTGRYVIFIEFHSTSWLKRLALWLATGYFSYDYKKLLLKHDFHDIELRKLKESDWPGGEPQKTFGYIITART